MRRSRPCLSHHSSQEMPRHRSTPAPPPEDDSTQLSGREAQALAGRHRLSREDASEHQRMAGKASGAKRKAAAMSSEEKTMKETARKQVIRAKAKAKRDAEASAAAKAEQAALLKSFAGRLWLIGVDGFVALGTATQRWEFDLFDCGEGEHSAFEKWLASHAADFERRKALWRGFIVHEPDYAALAAAYERGFVIELEESDFHDTPEAEAWIKAECARLRIDDNDDNIDRLLDLGQEHDSARAEALGDELPLELLRAWRGSEAYNAWYEREVGWKHVRPPSTLAALHCCLPVPAALQPSPHPHTTTSPWPRAAVCRVALRTVTSLHGSKNAVPPVLTMWRTGDALMRTVSSHSMQVW